MVVQPFTIMTGSRSRLIGETADPGGKSFINGEMVVEALRVIGQGGFGGGGGSRSSGHRGGVEDIQEVRVKATILGEEVLTQIQMLPSFPAQTSGRKVIITKLPTGVTAGNGMQQVLFKSNREVSDGRYEMLNSLGYSEANATN